MTEIEYWLSDRVEVTKEDISSYFNKCKKYRGMYLVEMKRQLATKLWKDGMRHREICSILKISISMISIYINKTKPLINEDAENVTKNLNEWIKNGLYPKSHYVYDYSNGYQEVETKYKLVKHYEL